MDDCSILFEKYNTLIYVYVLQELQWPVEGCLIPNVPPIKSLKSSQGAPICKCAMISNEILLMAFVMFIYFFLVVPIRLQVLKNGERDYNKSVSVVGPDISNVIIIIIINRDIIFQNERFFIYQNNSQQSSLCKLAYSCFLSTIKP